jgi:uncharacterized damage-inducible protein DinB
MIQPDSRRVLLASVASILDRDLGTLRRELEAYPDERDIWRLPPGVTNSAGTLALHLAGNLQHFLGATLGGTGYVRNRPAEFATRDLLRAAILQEVEAARAAVRLVADQAVELDADYPEVIGGVKVNTGDYLVHLVSHFAYHLGQIDYHRRVVTGQTNGVGAVRVLELATAQQVVTGPD